MREIKFRGKSRNTGEWIYGWLMGTREGDLMICEAEPSGRPWPDAILDQRTIGQYTGIKDCNGVEIYEGDLVKCHAPRIQGVYPVEYVTGAFCLTKDNFGYLATTVLADDRFSEILEVIGNVHDAKEEGGEG